LTDETFLVETTRQAVTDVHNPELQLQRSPHHPPAPSSLSPWPFDRLSNVQVIFSLPNVQAESGSAQGLLDMTSILEALVIAYTKEKVIPIVVDLSVLQSFRKRNRGRKLLHPGPDAPMSP